MKVLLHQSYSILLYSDLFHFVEAAARQIMMLEDSSANATSTSTPISTSTPCVRIHVCVRVHVQFLRDEVR